MTYSVCGGRGVVRGKPSLSPFCLGNSCPLSVKIQIITFIPISLFQCCILLVVIQIKILNEYFLSPEGKALGTFDISYEVHLEPKDFILWISLPVLGFFFRWSGCVYDSFSLANCSHKSGAEVCRGKDILS